MDRAQGAARLLAHLHPNRSADQELGCFLIDVSPRTDALLRVAAGHGMFGMASLRRKAGNLNRARQAAYDWCGDRPDLGPQPPRRTGFSRCARGAERATCLYGRPPTSSMCLKRSAGSSYTR
jgi:hypothetical protein